jgi:hypothetical protein
MFEGEEIMFYGQCNDCGQRWELGTARTCICKDEHMRDTIDMARESGWTSYDSQDERFKAFEALVRADERNRTWTQEHWTEYERSIAAAEREACAKMVDHILKEGSGTWGDAIRARGNT